MEKNTVVKFVLMAILTLLLGICAGCSVIADQDAKGTTKEANDASDKLIYLLVPDSSIFRFTKFDIPNIEQSLQEQSPEAKLKVLNAEGSATKQLAQVETAIAEGASGIILIAADSQQTAGMLGVAEEAGIPVVTYAHEAFGGPVNYHVSVPFTDIGEKQAEYMVDEISSSPTPIKLAKIYGDPKFAFYTDLKKGHDQFIEPLVKEGKIEVVCEADSMSWGPANAQKAMEQCLTKTKNQVDAVIVMNDDNGGGVVAALAAEGLEGKTKLYGGYDATLEGIQRMLVGWQEGDLSPPYKKMADTAVTFILSSIDKEDPPEDLINGSFDNGYNAEGVPAAYIPNVLITPSNVEETIVNTGVYSKEELCAGFAKDSEFCK